MKKLSTFEARYTYGQAAEQAFAAFLNFAKIPYTQYINESYWSKEFDLVNGDFQVRGENIDVKRNSISFRSLDNFKGKYYVVYHNDLSSPLVIETEEVKKLDRKNFDILESGSYGFKYPKLSKLKYMTFDEFFKTN